MSKPVIGITTDIQTVTNSRGVSEQRYFLKRALAEAVSLAGGCTLTISFVRAQKEARATLNRLDGLIISGGAFDIPPSLYRERRSRKCGATLPERTDSELLLLDAALEGGKPVLGLCGGGQLINVFFGGSLYQDIPSQLPEALRHSQREPHATTTHTVTIKPGSMLASITGKRTLKVNSTHHQAVKTLAKGLIATATASDGIVEAVEIPGYAGFLLGVQWHPEFLVNTTPHRNLFRKFVAEASAS